MENSVTDVPPAPMSVPPPPPLPAPSLSAVQSASMASDKQFQIMVTIDMLSAKDIDKKEKTKKERATKEKKLVELDTPKKAKQEDQDAEEHDECCDLFSIHHQLSYPSYSSSYQPSLQIISGSHEYVINGFSLYRYMGCGMRLCSDFFEVGGQLFRLEVYPGGFNPAVSQFLSVFLTSPALFNPNQIMYEVAVVDQSGEGRDIIASNKKRGKCQCCNNLTSRMINRGRGIVAAIPKMVEARFLKANCRSYSPCDTLVITASVEITTAQSIIQYAAPPAPYPHPVPLMAMPGSGYFLPSPPPPPMQAIYTAPLVNTAASYHQAASYQPVQEYYSSGPAASQIQSQPGSMSAQDQQYLVYMSTPQ